MAQKKICRYGTGFCFPILLAICMLFLSVPFVDGPGEAYANGNDDHVTRIDSPPPLGDMEKAPGWTYNTAYIYAISRAVRDSGMHDAGKVPLFVPSLILDTVLLPIALIAGLVGE